MYKHAMFPIVVLSFLLVSVEKSHGSWDCQWDSNVIEDHIMRVYNEPFYFGIEEEKYTASTRTFWVLAALTLDTPNWYTSISESL